MPSLIFTYSSVRLEKNFSLGKISKSFENWYDFTWFPSSESLSSKLDRQRHNFTRQQLKKIYTLTACLVTRPKTHPVSRRACPGATHWDCSYILWARAFSAAWAKYCISWGPDLRNIFLLAKPAVEEVKATYTSGVMGGMITRAGNSVNWSFRLHKDVLNPDCQP